MKKKAEFQVKFKLEPIIRMLSITIIVVLIIVFIYVTLRTFSYYETLIKDSSWILAYLVHIPQFVIPFLLINYISKGGLGEYGFNYKEKPPFTHKRVIGIGIFFGLLMSLEYIFQIVENAPLDIPYPITFVNVLGNMTFQWIFVGLSEETMFRGLIQTYLMKNLQGYVKILGHDLHIGTIISAIFWGGFHFINILYLPLENVIFFVILTTAIGLLMGYAYQTTGSLLTTILIHNTIFGVPLTIGYILYWL